MNRDRTRNALCKQEPEPCTSSRLSGLADLSAAVTEQRAAQLLGLSVKTLRNWRGDQIGPPYLKYGGRNGPVRYLLSDLIEWRGSHKRNTTEAKP